jgi:hypothetical protein
MGKLCVSSFYFSALMELCFRDVLDESIELLCGSLMILLSLAFFRFWF